MKLEYRNKEVRDLAGSPVVKTPCFHCRRCEFDPWLRNWDPTFNTEWLKKRKKEGREREGREAQEGVDVYNNGWFALLYSRNNIVNQFSLN